MISLYIATSLDGFIAKKDGSIDWLEDPKYEIEGEDYGYQEFFDSVDATIMGRSTYEQVLGFDVPFPYVDKRNFIFTHDKNYIPTFGRGFSDGVEKFMRNHHKSNLKFWLIGGGKVNTSFLEHNAIDEIRITSVPCILGDGIPLFNKAIDANQFKLKRRKEYDNGMCQFYFEKSR